MKLTTMTQVTVDGVVQGNGAASDEDRRNGFERGGWATGAGDDETRTLITRTYQRADAFLFGRRTYELFAGSWGATDEMRAHPVGVALNETPKYIASTTLTEPRWAHTTVLSGDLAAGIGERWGVPAGAPAGVVVHVKNGWLPRATHGWRIHSIGAFTSSRGWYTIVVLTQNNPAMTYGVNTIQNIARVIHRDLNPGATSFTAAPALAPSAVTPDEQIPALPAIP